MALVIKGSSSGQITVDVPAAAGTNTLTIPASTGEMLTTVNPKAGNVIQVVQGRTKTLFTTSSGTMADIGLSAAITPSSTSSITYKTTGRIVSSGGGRTVRFQDGSAPSTMTLMEIAG